MEKSKEFISKGLGKRIQCLNPKPFLDQFINKTVSDSLELGKDIKASEESMPVKLVVFGVKKMLIFYDQLN